MQISKVGVVALSLCVLSTGCLNNRYIAPVTTFHTSTALTITTLSAFYASRNSYEVHVYLDDIAHDPTLKVQTTDALGKRTALGGPVFSPASMRARLDALALVGVYASRLYDLANTTAPSDFASATTALGTSLSTLDKTFQTLGVGDGTAGAYVGPIASLIGIIGKMYLNEKRDKMVTEAIHEGAPKVNVILALIKDDMDKIFAPEVSTGTNQELEVAIKAYNDTRSTLSLDGRIALLAKIQDDAQAAAAATGFAPSQLVSSMIAANNALLASAQASKKDKPLTLASLNDALSAWISEIQSLATQIKPLVK